MAKIKVHNKGKVMPINIVNGTTLLEAVRSSGFTVYSPCGGQGKCGKCKVYIKDEGYVNACLYQVEEDIEIVLPEPSEANILASQYKYSLVLPFSPGKPAELSSRPFGVAIDLGTTTLAFYLINLKTGSLLETRTVMNPQAKWGADVISRINYCILNKGGLKNLQSEITGTINTQIRHFVKGPGISKDDIVKITICGNTTMLHLLLGVDPGPLAFVPFTPGFTDEQMLKASALEIQANPEAEVKVLPSLSAYIGADIVAGIASLAPEPAHKNILFVDLGTNGEIAVITPEKIYCCTTAAGPAFEGANIENGMGAFDGAISIYNGPGNYSTIGNSAPVGICGSGLIDLIASLVTSGNVKADGYLEKSFVVVDKVLSGTSGEICLTPKDIRELQLAKSAIVSGIKILIRQAGLSFGSIDALYLAGGFGNYIRTESAVKIGLIPHELKDKVIAVGNTSGTGAILAARSSYFDKTVSETLSKMTFVELSADEDFVMQFAMNMEFPT